MAPLRRVLRQSNKVLTLTRWLAAYAQFKGLRHRHRHRHARVAWNENETLWVINELHVFCSPSLLFSIPVNSCILHKFFTIAQPELKSAKPAVFSSPDDDYQL